MKKFDLNDIDRLLEKFVDGQTTEREERVLADFFSTADKLPTDWQAYKELFCSFKTDAYDFSDEEIHTLLSAAPSSRRSVVLRALRWTAVACVVTALAIVGVNGVDKAHTPSSKPALMAQTGCDANSKKVVAQNNVTTEPSHSTACGKAIAPTPHVHNSKTEPQKKMAVDGQNGQSGELMAGEQEVSTAEMLETVQMLAMTDAEGVTITASPRGSGFLIDAVCAGDSRKISSYELTRCADGTSLELKSIN